MKSACFRDGLAVGLLVGTIVTAGLMHLVHLRSNVSTDYADEAIEFAESEVCK